MSNEQLSFEALYERYYPEIFRFCFRKVRNQEDAEELANETFIKAYLNREQFDPAKGTYRAWLFQIARNLCIDFIRSLAYIDRQRFESLSESSSNREQHSRLRSTATGSNLDRHEVFWAIEECIERLGELADFIVLYYYHGFSLDEIAHTFGKKSPNWARKKLKRAEELLKECFESHDVDAFSLT